MKKTIKIKSTSSNEVYDVVFKTENNLISINCNCKAGLVKTICKHRMSLIEGDFTAISNENDIKTLNEIFNEIGKSKIVELFTEIDVIENEIKKLDHFKEKLRKEIGHKLSNGF